jgi:hypothetical protein
MNRGGVAVWRSEMIGSPMSWCTPALDTEGQPMIRPTWDAGLSPVRIIVSYKDIDVVTYREVDRFHVAMRRRRVGLSFKLTDASDRKVHKACAKAGEHSVYSFDYDTQEAVISVPDVTVTLDERQRVEKGTNGL